MKKRSNKKMTVAEVVARVEKIRERIADDEAAHGLEDELLA